MAKILFIGDVVGKPGRKALAQVLPVWQKEHKPDATIVNVENLAHGKGVTPSTLGELDSLDIDCYTSGNHIFKKNGLSAESFAKHDKLIRPANFPETLAGHGYYRFAKKITPSSGLRPPSPKGEKEDMDSSTQQYLVFNLNGQVFMEKQFEGEIKNPFFALDELIKQQSQKGDIIFLDFHAEATSEKIAMGFYSDGRITAMAGTHTHVPTADARVLPNGTGYVTDAGMTGMLNSVLGVKKESALTKFLEKGNFKYEIEEEGAMQVNGVLIEAGDDQRVVKIEKLYQEIK